MAEPKNNIMFIFLLNAYEYLEILEAIFFSEKTKLLSKRAVRNISKEFLFILSKIKSICYSIMEKIALIEWYFCIDEALG